MLKKVKLLKMSNFTFFHNVFYAICILKSFDSHISVVVCSFFEFVTASKWCIRKWAKAKQNHFPRIKLFGKPSYTDDIDHNLLYGYTNYWNVTKCTYLIKVIIPSLNHDHNPSYAHWNFIANANIWSPGAYIQVTECLHLLWNFSEHLKD